MSKICIEKIKILGYLCCFSTKNFNYQSFKISITDIIEVAKSANISDRINSLPDVIIPEFYYLNFKKIIS